MPINVGTSSVNHNIGGGGFAREGLYIHLDAGDTRSAVPNSANWLDLSGNNRDFTGTNVEHGDDVYGYWNLDGSDEYFLFQTISWDEDNDFSVEAWFQLNSTNELGSIVGQGKQGRSFGIDRNDNGTITWRVRGDSSANAQVTTSALSSGVWYHALGTYKGSSTTTKLYLDGVLIGTSTTDPGNISWSSGVDDDFRIGYKSTTAGSSSNMRYFDGNIAIVRVYQRTLTHSEVLFNYSADTMRFGK